MTILSSLKDIWCSPAVRSLLFFQIILADCTANSSKDPLGAVKSARKALRHLRACQVGIPDDEAKFPSQPYIAGVTSRAKTATAEARQWLVAVCWQSALAGHALEVYLRSPGLFDAVKVWIPDALPAP